MVRGVTEQTELVLSISGVNLGCLGGSRVQPSRRAFARPWTARQRTIRNAMDDLLGGRPEPDIDRVAEEAFAQGGDTDPQPSGPLQIEDAPSHVPADGDSHVDIDSEGGSEGDDGDVEVDIVGLCNCRDNLSRIRSGGSMTMQFINEPNDVPRYTGSCRTPLYGD